MGIDDSKPITKDKLGNEDKQLSSNSKKDKQGIVIQFPDSSQQGSIPSQKMDHINPMKLSSPKDTRLTTGMTKETSSLATRLSEPGKSFHIVKPQYIYSTRQTQQIVPNIFNKIDFDQINRRYNFDQTTKASQNILKLQYADKGGVSSILTKPSNQSYIYNKNQLQKRIQKSGIFDSNIFLVERNNIFVEKIAHSIMGQIILSDSTILLQKGTVLGIGILFDSNHIITTQAAIMNSITKKPFSKNQIRFSFLRGNRQLIKIDKIQMRPYKNSSTNDYCLLQIHGQCQPINCFAQNEEQLARIYLQKSHLFRVQVHGNQVDYDDECDPLKVVFHRYFIKYSLPNKFKTQCLGFIFTNESRIIAIQTDIQSEPGKGKAVLLTKQLIINAIVQFIEPLAPIVSSKQVNKRFSDPINFRIFGYEIDFITVNDIRLYYDLSKKHTVQFISKQYSKVTGKELILNYDDIKIPNTFLLINVIKNKVYKQQFEIYLRFLNRQNGYTYLNPLIYHSIKKLVHRSLLSLVQSAELNEIINNPTLSFIQIRLLRDKTVVGSYMTSREDDRTLKEIINKLANIDIYEVYTQKDILLDQTMLSKRLSQIPKEYRKFDVKVIAKKCWISTDSQILVNNIRQKKFKNLKVEQFLKNKTSYQVLSFSTSQFTLNNQYAVAFQEIKNLEIYYFIQYEFEKEKKQLYCSGEVTFYSSNNWKQIKDINVGQEILGVLQNEKETKYNHGLVNYKLTTKRKYLKKKPKNFHGFMMQINQTHSFVANNAIIHNRESIQVKYVSQAQDFSEQKIIKVYTDQKLSQYFEGYNVHLGGNLLDNNRTFADYNITLPKFLSLISSEQGSRVRANDDIGTCVTIGNRENRQLAGYNIRQDCQRWADQYLSIHQSRVSKVDSSFLQDISESKYINVIIEKKQILLRQFFYNHVETNISENFLQEQFSSDFNKIMRQLSVVSDYLTPEQSFYISHYTTSFIHTQLNQCLRKSSIQQISTNQMQRQLSFCRKLTQSLIKLQQLGGYYVVYRGLQERFFKLEEEHQQIRLFSSFISTSASLQIALKFAGNMGVVLVLNIISGKDIIKYSVAQQEQQVLIMPFTHFYFEKQYPIKDCQAYQYQAYQYTEIPLPMTNNPNLIFWVDDFPFHNMSVKEQISEKAEVISVTSTKIMKIIIDNFLWTYELLGKKSVFISDMCRIEDLEPSPQAGAELLEYVIQKGLSNKFIFYVDNVEKTRQILERRELSQPEIYGNERGLLQRLNQIFI